jgi:phage recombination protein Bet
MSSVSLAKQDEGWSLEQIKVLKQTVAKDCSDVEFALFSEVCKSRGLNPFAKQIYAVKRGGGDDDGGGGRQLTIQTSIDGYRLIAERTGKYAGQDDIEWCGKDGVWTNVWLQREPPLAARATVYRKDWARPMRRVAHLSFYRQFKRGGLPTAMWNDAKCPLMLGKCAEALAFRAAFSEEMSGLYISEEMGSEMEDISSPPRAPGQVIEMQAEPEVVPANANAEPVESAPEDPHAKDVFPARWPYEGRNGDPGPWAGTLMSAAPFKVLVRCKWDMRETLSKVTPGSKAANAILDVIERATYWVIKTNPDPTGALPNDGEIDAISEKYYAYYFHKNPDSEPPSVRELAADKLSVYIHDLEKEALSGREQAERVHFYLIAAKRVFGQRLAADIEAEEAEQAEAASDPESTPKVVEPAPEPEALAEAAPANATAEELKAWMDSQDIPKRTARARLPKRAAKDLDTQLAAATGKTVQQETR